MIHSRGKVFYPVSFCGASVQWSVYAAIPFHSNLRQRKHILLDLCMGFFLTPPISVFTKNAIHNNISSSSSPPKKKWRKKSCFFFFNPFLVHIFGTFAHPPKKHRKVPPEEQVAFNVMEAHSTGRLAKGAVGIQGGNRWWVRWGTSIKEGWITVFFFFNFRWNW